MGGKGVLNMRDRIRCFVPFGCPSNQRRALILGNTQIKLGRGSKKGAGTSSWAASIGYD